MQTHIRLLPQTVQTRSDLLGPSLFAIVSAYFEPYLYMLKLHCLITATFHDVVTIDCNVVGLILTWGPVLCKALISVA